MKKIKTDYKLFKSAQTVHPLGIQIPFQCFNLVSVLSILRPAFPGKDDRFYQCTHLEKLYLHYHIYIESDNLYVQRPKLV